LSETAIRTVVARVALAAHGDVFVPQLVNVAVVGSGELLDGLANTVAGARVGVARARGALASNTVIAVVAGAFTGSAVASALVGALHVIMGRVEQDVQVGVFHLRELLGGSVRIHEGILDDGLVRAAQAARLVKIALGGIDVGQSKLANTLAAIVSLPVAVANTHII